MRILVNWTGWLGFLILAGLGFTLYVYTFLPSNNCYVTPLYCFSIVHLYYLPLGIAGYFIASHLFHPRNVRLYLLLVLVLSSAFAFLPPPTKAQPIPVFFNVRDYYPFTYWVDTPMNVSYSTATVGSEFYVFEWAFFWPYHQVTFASTCAPAIPTNDWELVYVYVSFATQQLIGVAYRFHCSWTFISAADPGGIVSTPVSSVISPNATRPVITFVSRYHVPVNDYPGSRKIAALIASGLPDFQGSFSYIQQDYNFTQTTAVNPNASPISPDFFRSTNWLNIEYLTIAGFILWPLLTIGFVLERRKLAGYSK